MPSPPLPVTFPVATMLTRPPPPVFFAYMPWWAVPVPEPVTVAAVTTTLLDALAAVPAFLA